jgi:hypothetical protein
VKDAQALVQALIKLMLRGGVFRLHCVSRQLLTVTDGGNKVGFGLNVGVEQRVVPDG